MLYAQTQGVPHKFINHPALASIEFKKLLSTQYVTMKSRVGDGFDNLNKCDRFEGKKYFIIGN